MEEETIKKSLRENLGKMSEIIGAIINNWIQEIEERISGTEDTRENIDTTIKKMQKEKSS